MKKSIISLIAVAAILTFGSPLFAEEGKNPELPAEGMVQGQVTEPAGSAEKAAGMEANVEQKNPELPAEGLVQGQVTEPVGSAEKEAGMGENESSKNPKLPGEELMK